MFAATQTQRLTTTRPWAKSALNWRNSLVDELTWHRVAITFLLLAMTTAASYWNHSFEQPITGPLVYLLGVSFIAATQGLFLGLVSAVAGALITNYLIDRPAFTFDFGTIRDFAPMAAMSIAAVISGTLANRVRDKARQADDRARELAILLDASRRMESALQPDEIVAAVESFAPANLGLEAVLLIGRTEEAQANAPTSVRAGTWITRKLIGRSGAVGTIMFRHLSAPGLASEATIDGFINIVTIALERCVLLNRLADAQAIERSEAFKTAILSSISHDIRTPLAAISTSASGLMDYDAELSASSKTQLVTTIKEQCARLSRYTEKLLNLGRLQAGIDASKLPVVDLIDVVGGAVNHIRPLLGKRRIKKALGAGPIFVRADAVLMEQVIINVLDNAVLYSPDGSEIELDIVLKDGLVSATITDEGVGIPSTDLERVFDRFYRVQRPGLPVGGSGLGLAIAKGFATMVGGSIRAESPVAAGLGTRMVITLPLAEPG